MKQKITLGLSIFFLGTLIISCGRNNENGNGTYREDDNTYNRPGRPERPDGRGRGSTVMIAKSDESLQCRPGSGWSLSEMARTQLRGIHILSSSRQHNGQIVKAACNYETGMMNVYEIYSEDMGEALREGFFLL